MPYSSNVFDKNIEEALRFIKPDILLDLGAGAGKYGLMARKNNFALKTIAVETESDYIEKFNLHSIYTEVWNTSCIDLIRPEHYGARFDVVIIGDLIEHLKKSDGVDLLNFLIYRSRWIVVQVPRHYVQNIVGGHSSEAHVSVWAETDFLPFERTKIYVKDTQRLIFLRGYLENEISVELMESHVNV